MSSVSKHKIVILLLLLSLTMVGCHRWNNTGGKDPITSSKLEKDDEDAKPETEPSDETTIPDANESGKTNSKGTESDVVLGDVTDITTEKDDCETEITEDAKIEETENPFNLDEDDDGFIDGWY